ncbi:MAG: cohesin domain-containing protein, partial [Anaerolineae bacterium]|nr:cohesin domain-containing protein [Anaerolineae bacterium]
MSLKHFWMMALLVVCLFSPAAAQEQTAVLSLTAETTALQTGQDYLVSIRVDNAPAVWSMNLEMEYDPKQLYIMGTRSGSPVSQGSFFSPPDATIVVRNEIRNNHILYTISKLGETEPAQG